MLKAMLFFLIMTVGGGWVVGSLYGGGGIQSTNLTAAINKTDTTIPVVTTNGFLTSGILFIDNEEIEYSNVTSTTFVLTSSAKRGVNSTTADSHASAKTVFSETGGAVNIIMNFDVSTLWNNQGLFALPKIGWQFFTRTIPALAKGNFIDIFDGPLAIIASIWMCFGGAFIVLFVMWVISLIRGN